MICRFYIKKLLLLIAVMFTASCVNTHNNTAATMNSAQLEHEIFTEINNIRKSIGAGKLTRAADLDRAASMHSTDMAKNNFFSHKGSNGSRADTRAKQQKITFQAYSENLAMNCHYPQPARYAIQGWLKSKEHYDNLIDKQYTETGISAVYAGDGCWYFTQVFCKRIK